MPFNILLTRELAPGEAVLWQGTPRMRSELLNPGNWLFLLLWIGFSNGWLVLALSLTSGPRSLARAAEFQTDSLLPLAGVIIAILGALFLLPPAILAVLRTRRTLHAITDRRLLRIRRGVRLRVLMVPLPRIDSVIGGRSSSGWGTIRVSATTVEDGRSLGSAVFYLRGVPDAARAHGLLARGPAVSLQL